MRGAQRLRHVNQTGEGASTVQRSRWLSRQLFGSLLIFHPNIN
jgi:hypothetical protein